MSYLTDLRPVCSNESPVSVKKDLDTCHELRIAILLMRVDFLLNTVLICALAPHTVAARAAIQVQMSARLQAAAEVSASPDESEAAPPEPSESLALSGLEGGSNPVDFPAAVFKHEPLLTLAVPSMAAAHRFWTGSLDSYEALPSPVGVPHPFPSRCGLLLRTPYPGSSERALHNLSKPSLMNTIITLRDQPNAF